MMCADAGLHADQARRQVGEPGFHLATRPLLPQHQGSTAILADQMERVLADIDADDGDFATAFLGHGVLLCPRCPSPAWPTGRAGARPDHPITGLALKEMMRGQMISPQLDVGHADHFAHFSVSSVISLPKSAGAPTSA